MYFEKVFPEPDVLIELEPEEAGEFLLLYLNYLLDTSTGKQNRFNRSNTISPQTPALLHYASGFVQPHQYDGNTYSKAEKISEVLSEAWSWLEREGFLAPSADVSGSGSKLDFVTRRGRKIKLKDDFKQFTHLNLLPRNVLDPILSKKVWSSYIRGEFETAIFSAFKEVEIRMRKAAGASNKDITVNLARKAFNPETGVLTDKEAESGEKQACMELFSGVIGFYKSPSSHRDVDYEDPITAVSLILLANNLLKIIDQREV